MKATVFEVPQILNMGFHYTPQYSRRTRVNVMGLVDQSSEAWNRWYLRMHERDPVKEIVRAGYSAIEIHFMYGFGLEGEREEWELTARMAANAHAEGLKVFGYFQFHSVQEELFFLENPWAEDCVQIDAAGKRIGYDYDRPALCTTDPRVKQYYLDGVELGLRTCDLDGIRLDNDYLKGCYCHRCQAAFKEWLASSFDEKKARRVFGLARLDGMSLSPVMRNRDPLYNATVLFRQKQRQDIMRAIHDRIVAIKPDAILGGNPGIIRRYRDTRTAHVHIPDLSETHHLVCAENKRFPARTGDTFRHQVAAYKYGQSGQFAVFASHHLMDEETDSLRWPDTFEECVLSMCEGLAFGGHPVCTCWGLRMDETEDKTLYQRPLFLGALKPVSDFVRSHPELYRGAVCNAGTGIYQNRESLAFDAPNAWISLHGAVQVMLQHKLPFRFVDRDEAALFEGLETVIVPDVQRVSDEAIGLFMEFLNGGGTVLVTGQSMRFDEWGLAREAGALDAFREHPNVKWIEGTPEKFVFDSEKESLELIGDDNSSFFVRNLPLPREHRTFADAVRGCPGTGPVTVEGSDFVAVDTFCNPEGIRFLHLLNYDNANPCNVTVTFREPVDEIEGFMPEGLGCTTPPEIRQEGGVTRVHLNGLHTYAVLRYRPAS